MNLTLSQRQMMYKFLHHCNGWRIESSPLGTTKVSHYGNEMRVSAAMSPKAPYTPIQGTEQEAHTALSHIPACWKSSGSLPLQKWNKSLFSDTAMPRGREMYILAFPDPVQLYLSCYFLHRMMMWFYLDCKLCSTETSDPTMPIILPCTNGKHGSITTVWASGKK